MSANNWSVCPRCLQKMKDERRREEEEVQKSYGKVSAEEYMRQVARLQAAPTTPDESLREDWELFIRRDGEVYISYSASCERCGFNYNFKHEEQVNVR